MRRSTNPSLIQYEKRPIATIVTSQSIDPCLTVLLAAAVNAKRRNRLIIAAKAPRINSLRSRAFDSFSKKVKNSMGCGCHPVNYFDSKRYIFPNRLVVLGNQTEIFRERLRV